MFIPVKKIIAVIVMCAAVAFAAFAIQGDGGDVVVAQNAPAAAPVKPAPVYKTQTCATKAAYQRLHKGQSKRHAAWLFRHKGKRSGTASTHIDGRKVTAELRSYKTCAKSGSVTVMYVNGKVVRKSVAF
jgi:hypothetical protein